MQTLSDLIHDVEAGDLSAYEDVVSRFQDMAFGYAYARIGDFHLAEDIAQEAFLTAYLKLSDLRDPEAFPGWFRQILRSCCSKFSERKTPVMIPLDVMSNTLPGDGSPHEILQKQEDRNYVFEAVKRLPEMEKMVITLFYMGSYSYKEISAFLDVSTDTINNRMRSARKLLKKGMLDMAKEKLRESAPSNDDEFVNVVGICNAAQAGDLVRVQQIVAQRPELAHRDGELGYQAIHYAAKAGHLDIVLALLESGANPIRRTYGEGVTALEMAKNEGHLEIVRVMEDWRASSTGETDDGIALCEAVARDDLETVVHQIDENPSAVHSFNKHGNTPLHVAVEHCRVDILLELLHRGADPNRANRAGKRPIHIALGPRPKRGWDPPPDPKLPIVAGILVGQGADYDLWVASAVGDVAKVSEIITSDPGAINDWSRYFPDMNGYPISIAAYHGHLDVVKCLLESGADPDTPHDKEGGYHVAERGAPLSNAVRNDDLEMTELLLRSGASANTVRDSSGNALGTAITNGNNKIEKLLLKYGAIPGHGGKITPGFYAQYTDNITVDVAQVISDVKNTEEVLKGAVLGGHPELVEVCLAQDLSLSENRVYGVMALAMRMWRLRCPSNPGSVCAQDFYDCFELLLEKGFDPNAKQRKNDTSLLHLTAEITWYVGEADRIVFAEKLLNHGAELNVIGGERQSTPLGLAVLYGWPKLAEFFLEKGADPNLAGADWAKPLAWAKAPQGHPEYEHIESDIDITTLLRRHGAV